MKILKIFRIHSPVLAMLCLPLIILLGGCVTPATPSQLASLDYGSYPTDSEETIRDYFNSVLFDPYSAHYDFEQPVQQYYKTSPLLGGKIYAGYFVRVSVNAKNQMGGYTGAQMYGFLIKNGQIVKLFNQYDLLNMSHK